ncbi:hypothetical protein XENTR_v10022326 [Xenopus tropicalis]|nr:hypothetical protein XENTR_v10022326 [Xenopus tropicalis]
MLLCTSCQLFKSSAISVLFGVTVNYPYFFLYVVLPLNAVSLQGKCNQTSWQPISNSSRSHSVYRIIIKDSFHSYRELTEMPIFLV